MNGLKEISFNTRYNKFYSDIIKNDLLLIFEDYKYTIQTNSIDVKIIEDNKIEAQKKIKVIKDKILSRIMQGYKKDEYSNIDINKRIYGFPLHLQFTNFETIWQEIKSTCIHDILTNDIEYILSVKLFSYPGNIISVWVYIAVVYNEFN